MYHVLYSFFIWFRVQTEDGHNGRNMQLRYFIFSKNIVLFKTVYPSTIAHLWLTNTTRMTHLEDCELALPACWRNCTVRPGPKEIVHIPKKNGIDWRKRIFISTLYSNECDEVQLDQRETSVKFGKRFKKGNCLSLIVLYFTANTLTRKLLNGRGLQNSWKVIYVVKYVDDLVILTKEETALDRIIDRKFEIGKNSGMEIYVEETMLMRMSRRPFPIQIMIQQKRLENVEYFIYFGSLITNDVRCRREIDKVLPWHKQHSARRRIFSPINWTYFG